MDEIRKQIELVKNNPKLSYKMVSVDIQTMEKLLAVYDAAIELDATFNIDRCFDGTEVNEFLAALADVSRGS